MHTSDENGLNSVDRVLEAADALTGAADAAQAWIKRQLDERAIQAAQAHELFTSVNQIRGMANLLYTTAAAAVVKALGESQADVVGLIKRAEKCIAKIGKAKDMIDLIADLIALAAAINGGKAGAIVATLDEVRTDVQDISRPG
jgi:signal transduction histidine kinase